MSVANINSPRATLSRAPLRRNSERGAGRPSERKDLIVTRLRRDIVEGRLAPGTQIPLRTEIEQEFAASPLTVQKALDQLKEEGFVHSKGRLGTFVKEEPPHLSRYAVIFPAHPFQGQQWRRFWTAISNEILALAAHEDRDITIYHGVDGHTDSVDYQNLQNDVCAHRLAGLIFAISPERFLNTPLLDEPGMPRVAITGRTDLSGVQAVALDPHSWIDKALDELAAQGRRRVALIGGGAYLIYQREYFLSALAKRGMTTQPYWMQILDLAMPETAVACVQLLMHSRGVEPFDSLLVTDDNLVEHATAGILASGARVPEDVSVVAHCNFPWPTPSTIPVKRLGYDARTLMTTCLELVDRGRQGEKTPVVTSVEAVWEHEAHKSPHAGSSET